MNETSEVMPQPSEHSINLVAQDTSGGAESSQGPHFHLFEKLPREIQHMIFQACIPRRVFRFTYERLKRSKTGPKSEMHISEKPSALPWIAFVCKDAYKISKLYVREYLMDYTKIFSLSVISRQCGTTRIRFDLDLDTLYVNYGGITSDEDPEDDHRDHDEYLKGLVNGPYALVKRSNINFILEMECLVGPRNRDLVGEMKWLTASPYQDCLIQHRACTVDLATTTFWATRSELRSSGLFGLFGEERYVFIDIRDTAKIDKYEKYIQGLEAGDHQPRKNGWSYFPEDEEHLWSELWKLGGSRYGTFWNSILGELRTEQLREDDEPRLRYVGAAERDTSRALTLIKQSWLESKGCFEPEDSPTVPWTGDEFYRRWDDEHPVAKHYLSQLPTFHFVALYMATDPPEVFEESEESEESEQGEESEP